MIRTPILHILLAILLSLTSVTITMAQQSPIEQNQNQRQFLLLWQQDRVSGIGIHRPYSNLIVTNQVDDIIWQGKTDPRGQFSFLLPPNALTPSSEHLLTLTPFDQFDTPILTSTGEPDTLQALLLPGLTTQGITHPNATIILKDPDGNILNSVRADNNGNYVLHSAPAQSTIHITKDQYSAQIPFEPDQVPPTYFPELITPTESGQLSSDQTPSETLRPVAPESSSADTNNALSITLISMLLVSIISVGGFIWWRRHHSET